MTTGRTHERARVTLYRPNRFNFIVVSIRGFPCSRDTKIDWTPGELQLQFQAMKRLALQCIFGLAMAAASMHAHHSLSGSYDMGQDIQIEGIVVQFQFVNPHPFLTISVEPRKGEKQQWRLELDNRSELVGIGMTSSTLKPGDRVVVKGNPGLSQQQTLYVRRLDRPADGLKYEQIGASPQIEIPNKR
jgi:hypothetical protein